MSMRAQIFAIASATLLLGSSAAFADGPAGSGGPTRGMDTTNTFYAVLGNGQVVAQTPSMSANWNQKPTPGFVPPTTRNVAKTNPAGSQG